MTRRVWAAARAGCLAGIPLSKERKLRRLLVPLCLSWKRGLRLWKRWQQFRRKERKTLSVGEVGWLLLELLGKQTDGGGGVDWDDTGCDTFPLSISL